MNVADELEASRLCVAAARVRLELVSLQLARVRRETAGIPSALPSVVGQFLCRAEGGPFADLVIGLPWVAKCVDVFAHDDGPRTPTLTRSAFYLGSYFPDAGERVPSVLHWRGAPAAI